VRVAREVCCRLGFATNQLLMRYHLRCSLRSQWFGTELTGPLKYIKQG